MASPATDWVKKGLNGEKNGFFLTLAGNRSVRKKRHTLFFQIFSACELKKDAIAPDS